MASVSNTTTGFSKGASTIAWEGLGAVSSDDVGGMAVVPGFADVSIQVLGTFANATITIQGSNDGGTTWATLNDLFGSALTFTAAGIKGLAEVPKAIRPVLTSGSSSDLDVIAVVRVAG